MAKLAIFALAISAMLVSSNAFMGFRKLQQVSMRQVLLGTVQPSVGWCCLSQWGSPQYLLTFTVNHDFYLQDGLLNCGGVLKLGESAASNKCCELCFCIVSNDLHRLSQRKDRYILLAVANSVADSVCSRVRQQPELSVG